MSFKINESNGQIDITKGDVISLSLSYTAVSSTQLVSGDKITFSVYKSLANPHIFTKDFTTVVDGVVTVYVSSAENDIPAGEGYYYKITKTDALNNVTTLVPDYPQQYARLNVYN
jgi:hypothetical protein